MVKCCVKGCHNIDFRTKHRLFRVPSKVKRTYLRHQWMQSCGLSEDDVVKDERVCEVHFTRDCFERVNFSGLMGLKSNAVPTVFGDNLPRVGTAVPVVNAENILPEPRSPLADSNQPVEDPLTPVSKRRRSYSVAEAELSECDKLRISLNEALKERNHYKRMVQLLLFDATLSHPLHKKNENMKCIFSKLKLLFIF